MYVAEQAVTVLEQEVVGNRLVCCFEKFVTPTHALFCALCVPCPCTEGILTLM